LIYSLLIDVAACYQSDVTCV